MICEKKALLIFLIFSLYISFMFLSVALADGCEHTNVDRYPLSTYEPIVGNGEVHKVTIWMQTTCMDCFDLIDETVLTTSEEKHQFEENGSVLICKWCGYQTTEDALQVTPAPTAVSTATPVPTATPRSKLLNDEYSRGDYKYQLYTNGDAVITGYTGNDSKLTIPAKIDGHPIVEIKYQAFQHCTFLKSVVIPYGVTDIGDFAFFECSLLTSVSIPESVTTIGTRTFAFCEAIEEINLPNSVTSIGSHAFAECTSLKSIKLPDNVEYIYSAVFSGCKNLNRIELSDSNPYFEVVDGMLIDWRNREVRACTNAKTRKQVTIPEGVASIGYDAFSGFVSLQSVTFPDSVTSVDEGAFGGCVSLTTITTPNNVASIGDFAFSGCESLPNVSVFNSVTSIGGGAFSGCDSLKYVFIPGRVTEVLRWTFSDCDSLTEVVLQDGITTICAQAFQDCKNLKYISIPKSVTHIEENAFKGSDRVGIWYYDNSYAFKYAREIASVGGSAALGNLDTVLPEPIIDHILPRKLLHVYSGPGTEYYRGGKNNNAEISTDEDFKIWGYENGWYMISYRLNQGGNRVGYIKKTDYTLPVGKLQLQYHYPAFVMRDVVVTDDPDGLATSVAVIREDSRVTYLATYYGENRTWYYIEFELNGKKARGFIPNFTLAVSR